MPLQKNSKLLLSSHLIFLPHFSVRCPSLQATVFSALFPVPTLSILSLSSKEFHFHSTSDKDANSHKHPIKEEWLCSLEERSTQMVIF